MEEDVPTKLSDLENDLGISGAGGVIQGDLAVKGALKLGKDLPSKGDGSTVYHGIDLNMLTTVSGISGLYTNSAKQNQFYCLHYNDNYTCTCNKCGDTNNLDRTTEANNGLWLAGRYTETGPGTSGYLGNLFEGGLDSGAIFGTENLATEPLVFTITSKKKIDSTDTAAIGLTG